MHPDHDTEGHRAHIYLYLDKARLLWIKESQTKLQSNPNFPTWQHQFGLFKDESQLWRYGGRLGNSHLPASVKNPILLDKNHYFSSLVVLDAHRRVMRNGVKETLTEIRSTNWLVQGRQFVKRLLHKCVVCRRTEG